MANNCSISTSAEVAAVKAVVDATKVIADAYDALKPASGTIDTAETMKNRILSPSEDLLSSNDTEAYTQSLTYILVREVLVVAKGLYRIKFDMKSEGAGVNQYARIYKNDVAYGTEQRTTSLTYVTKSEDLVIGVGDRVQLYIKSAHSSWKAYEENFRLYGILNSTWFLNTL